MPLLGPQVQSLHSKKIPPSIENQLRASFSYSEETIEMDGHLHLAMHPSVMDANFTIYTIVLDWLAD